MLWLEPAQHYCIPNLDSYHYVYNSMAMYNQFPQRFRYANHIIVFFDVSMKSASLCIFRKEPLTVGGKLTRNVLGGSGRRFVFEDY
ncbi:hypothetical protein ISN44_As11g001060, partial [Arabidopsis suecica]